MKQQGFYMKMKALVKNCTDQCMKNINVRLKLFVLYKPFEKVEIFHVLHGNVPLLTSKHSEQETKN